MAQKLKPKEICALKPYHFKINKENDILIINPKMMIKEILKDLAKRVTKPVIAYKFHLTIAQMILETCQKIRKLTGINQVALSGGVFQNQILLSRAEGLLRKHNFRVFTHQEFPSNDSSISVGQTVIANSRY
jgi:hydrogenase maturation protein HypF